MLTFFAATSFAAWILLFAGLSQRRESRRRNEREHTRAAGRIVGYAFEKSGGAYACLKPVVEFEAEGERIRAVYENGMDRERFPVGEPVDILYDVSDPSRFHLEADPVFISGGAGAIRVSLIWIVVSAALTLALAVFVGGLDLDLRRWTHRIQWFFRRLR